MDCKEIIEKYLKDNGYDGLYHGSDCGCEISSLFPCDGFFGECEPGYKSTPEPDSEWAGGADWVIGQNKPQAAKEAGNDNI